MSMNSNTTLPSSDTADATSAWTSASPLVLAMASSCCLIVASRYIYPAIRDSKSRVDPIGGLSIANVWAFFNKRYDFLRSNFDKGHDMFSFKILHHEVVALSGENSRSVFFHDKTLDFAQGYALLMGGAPKLQDVKPDAVEEGVGAFNKRLAKILRRDRIQDVIPTLFSDVNKRMEGWGNEGQMNPFNDINTLVFQMTVRMATCSELSTNFDDLKKMSELYWKLEHSATPVGLLLPWFPSQAKRDKKEATQGLYDMIVHYISLRRNADVPSSDAFDLLIAGGENDADIVSFVLAVIFAGVINTGMISCWTTIYLSMYPEWKAKAVAEIEQLIAKHTNTTSSEALHQRLSAVPISAWEEEMPVLEAVIRETIRLVINATFLRRNVAGDLDIAGKTIPRGAFMAYHITDAHHNAEYYPDPLTFNPGRFNAAEEEGQQGSAPFLGWGTGRHPCTGMKVAKLEVKMILALVLTRYEYALVDAAGKPTSTLPEPNKNDIHQARPLHDCYIRYRKVVE